MQRKNRHRIQLLVTLVLFVLAATSTWMTSRADARGLFGPGTSVTSGATRPGADLASGDPDAGQGAAPPPPPTMKHSSGVQWMGNPGRATFGEWIGWAGRIWATVFLRILR